jgi:hypothetical protein
MRNILLLCLLFAVAIVYAPTRTITGKITNNKRDFMPFRVAYLVEKCLVSTVNADPDSWY